MNALFFRRGGRRNRPAGKARQGRGRWQNRHRPDRPPHCGGHRRNEPLVCRLLSRAGPCLYNYSTAGRPDGAAGEFGGNFCAALQWNFLSAELLTNPDAAAIIYSYCKLAVIGPMAQTRAREGTPVRVVQGSCRKRAKATLEPPCESGAHARR